jgi:hypothetical protein
MPDRLRAGTLSPEDYVDLETRRLAVCRKKPSADLVRKWHQAFTYLEEILTACREHQTPVAFILIPDEVQVNPGVLQAVVASGKVDRAAFDLDLPQRRLQEFLVRRGVDCLDLRPVLNGLADAYVPCNTHWSVHGNHLAAERIAAWLPQTTTSSPP